MNTDIVEYKLKFEAVDAFFSTVPHKMVTFIDAFVLTKYHISFTILGVIDHPLNIPVEEFYQYLKYKISNECFNADLVNATKEFIKDSDGLIYEYDIVCFQILIEICKCRLKDKTIKLFKEEKQEFKSYIQFLQALINRKDHDL